MAMFNSYVSLPEGIRPTLYHGQNMATHKFNKGTSWKSMQFTHPHVSKWNFLYGHNKGYQHVSTTTSPPCQAMLTHPKDPKSPIDQYRSVYPPSNFLHSIIHPYHPCHDLIPSTFLPTQFSPQLYSSIHLVLQIPRAWRFGCGCWDWWPNAWLVGWEDREPPFFGGSKSCYSVDVPLEQLRGGAAFQWIDRESDKTNSWV